MAELVAVAYPPPHPSPARGEGANVAPALASPPPSQGRVREGGDAVLCDKVTVRFTTERGTVTALQDVSIAVPAGSLMTLLGPSGCGKSTLLRVVADLIEPSSGTATVLGGKPSEARKRRDIGFVFQDAALLPWRSALQNVELPLEVGGDGTARRPTRTPRELLELVGLKGWENAFPNELSGGMRQRVSIARALVNEPKLLLMDEPFGALDEITRDRLNEELLRIWEETAVSILFVTHSIYEAAFLGQQVLMLAANPGRVREIVPIDFPSPRRLTLRESADFVQRVAHLRRVLESC
jgi:NitT/TauT family transport system ATP-binding protein